MNQKIDEDGGEGELRRAAMELTIPGNEAGMGKVAGKPSVPVSGEEPPRLPRNGGTSYSAFRSGSRR